VLGKLLFCIGLPIIIRHNYTTELCITKGQEGTICGWDSSKGVDGKRMLETLYVKFTAPPKDVHILGLKPNVVPVPKMTMPIICKMPDDSMLRISRTQISVLSCFSMTDYASQGKMQVFNVADLGHCRMAQSYLHLSVSQRKCCRYHTHPTFFRSSNNKGFAWLFASRILRARNVERHYPHEVQK